jgi:hypothetical protein
MDILVDNLQREDPSPSAEAVLIKRLHDSGLCTAKEIASHLGKPERWAQRRMALLGLHPILLDLWNSGRINTSAATMEALATVSHEMQEEITGLDEDGEVSEYDFPSSREDVMQSIARIGCRVDQATWMNDPRTFVEGCGPGCASSSDSKPELFDFHTGAEGKKNKGCAICTNSGCFNKRLQLHLESTYDDLRKKHPDAKFATRTRITLHGEVMEPDWSVPMHSFQKKPSKGSKPWITYSNHDGFAVLYERKASATEADDSDTGESGQSPEQNAAERAKKRIAGLEGKRWLKVRKELLVALEATAFSSLTVPIDSLVVTFGLPYQEDSLASSPVDPGLWDYIFGNASNTFPERGKTEGAYGNTIHGFTGLDLPREEALWPSVKKVLIELIPEPNLVSDAPKFAETYRKIAKLINFPITLVKRRIDMEIPPPKSWGKVDPHTLQPV